MSLHPYQTIADDLDDPVHLRRLYDQGQREQEDSARVHSKCDETRIAQLAPMFIRAEGLETGGKSFREEEQVRCHDRQLVCKHSAGPAEAGNDLIDDEGNPVPCRRARGGR